MHPHSWGPKVYLFTGLALLAVNLFGPNGGLRWLLLEQEIARTRHAQAKVQAELARTQRELELFDRSDTVRERKIRDVLGYLKADEVSVELVDGSPNGPATSVLNPPKGR